MVSVLCSSNTKSAGQKDEVYVAAVALRATKGPAQLLMSGAYSLNHWDLQHFLVIVKPPSSYQSQASVFDFQPKDPESIYVALAAISSRAVPGVVLVRKVTKLPRRKCWFVGYSKVMDTVNTTHIYNGNWQTDLKVGHHDCRHYTNGLVEYLTGQKHVLERLKRSIYG